jgi:hypothetical protein
LSDAFNGDGDGDDDEATTTARPPEQLVQGASLLLGP